MRPRGGIRKAVAEHMAAAQEGATWRDLAQRLEDQGLINTRAPSEMELVRRAVENMKRAGEIEPVGERRTRWSRRPLKLYGARRAACDPAEDSGAALAAVIGQWSAQVGDEG